MTDFFFHHYCCTRPRLQIPCILRRIVYEELVNWHIRLDARYAFRKNLPSVSLLCLFHSLFFSALRKLFRCVCVHCCYCLMLCNIYIKRIQRISYQLLRVRVDFNGQYKIQDVYTTVSRFRGKNPDFVFLVFLQIPTFRSANRSQEIVFVPKV